MKQETSYEPSRIGLSERAMRPLPDDDERVVAFGIYSRTEDYANAQKWAVKKEHTKGSLWAAFITGWEFARAPKCTINDALSGIEPTLRCIQRDGGGE